MPRSAGWLILFLGFQNILSFASEYADFFHEIEDRSDICDAFTIGKTVNGADIWGMRINGNATDYRLPKVKLVGQIHGNEPRTRDVLIHLIEYLCLQSSSRTLVQSTDIYVIPSLNIDGHPNKRKNANSIDLSRNFPDTRFPARTLRPIQPETEAYMNFSTEEAFILGLSFHSGELVSCIPYNSGPRIYSRDPQPTSDDALFRVLAGKYVDHHPRMKGSTRFPGGIVNGAEWYTHYGGLIDWDYSSRGCNSLIIEICRDCTKSGFFYWEENKRAILSFLGAANQNRVYGVLVDSNDITLSNYKVNIKNAKDGRTGFVYSNSAGVFHKVLTPGQYQLRLINRNHNSVMEKNFTISNQEYNVFLGNLIIH